MVSRRGRDPADRRPPRSPARPAAVPARRREEIFLLWDDCATDAIGTRARTLVEDFIRSELPLGTSLAYTEPEIERFNRRRATRIAFDPYRASRDGGA